MKNTYDFQKQKIKLDIGGHRFSTTLSTLTSVPNTFFTTMLSGDYTMHPDDDDGSFFLDRDGRHFHYILNYLRSPETFELPRDPALVKELLKEAEFYKIVRPSILSSLFFSFF